MELSIQMYFLLFMIYSILGWCLEVICKAFEYKKFINRGFLIGPYCPIYGWGAILITFLLYRYSYDALVLFVMTTIVCGILEYLTSFFMEKLFKARWWDYSHKKYNINGRVCLDNILAFGILGLLMMFVINPFIVKMLGYVNVKILNIISLVLFIVFIVDLVVSLKIISSFKNVAKSIHKDSTEEITKKVKEILSKRGKLYKRLVSAFEFEASEKLVKDIKNKVKDVAEDISDLVNNKKKKMQKKNELIAEYRKNLRTIKAELRLQKEELNEKLKKLK